VSLFDDPKRVAIISSLLFISAGLLCVLAAILEIVKMHRPDYAVVWAVLALFFENLVMR
jgi:hypothetical protein